VPKSHSRSERFPVNADALFSLLIRPTAICSWWGAARAVVVPAEDGIWVAAWGEDPDRPDYVSSARIDIFEPPTRLFLTDSSYHARDGGPPFEANFTISYKIREISAVEAELTVTQDGFPESPAGDKFLGACEVGWRDTFAGIRKYIEKGE